MERVQSSKELQIVNEVHEFLDKNYPTRLIDVRHVVSQINFWCKRESMFDVVRDQIQLTIDFAKEGGLKQRDKGNLGDITYIPGRLAGITKFEDQKKEELAIKQLPLSRYLGILAIGEITNVRKGLSNGWNIYTETFSGNLDRFNKLIKLHQELKKVNSRL